LRWIAFDLDDTLHYFKRASGTAAEESSTSNGGGPGGISETPYVLRLPVAFE
jgi:hypothetical protein